MATLPIAGAFAPGEMVGLRTEVEVPFTTVVRCGTESCILPLDVVAPAEGDGHPTIVLLQGGPAPFHERRNPPMIEGLVQRGAVVFVASYRSHVTGDLASDSYDDVRCAVNYARAHAAEFGGDPSTVVLVGQSFGSVVALQLAVEPPNEPEMCLAPGSGVPDAVVGLAGFGVQMREISAGAPPMWLVAGSEDHGNLGPGRDDFADLQEAGYEVNYHELEGVTHPEMFDPNVTPEAVDIIFDAIDAVRRT